MENKKGLSTIVVTLIIILLSLVAVGVVWGVVNNLIKSGSEGVDVNSKCLNINIEATAVDCDVGYLCDVTMTRTGTMDVAIAGVKLVFKNATSEDSSALITIGGNIETLVGKKVLDQVSIATADTVEITPYFVDASGKEQICSQSSSFEF